MLNFRIVKIQDRPTPLILRILTVRNRFAQRSVEFRSIKPPKTGGFILLLFQNYNKKFALLRDCDTRDLSLKRKDSKTYARSKRVYELYSL